MTDYSGVHAKLKRAEFHLSEFERVLREWLNSSPISFVSAFTPDDLHEELRVSLSSGIPPQLDLILGDCVHNFRSALDHLAMALAINFGANVYDTSVMFPIYDDANEFLSNGLRRISKMDPAAQAFVESLQPYHLTFEGSWLWELNELDNEDKHRTLLTHELTPLVVFAGPTGIRFDFPGRWVIEDGALFATVIYDSSYKGPPVRPPIHAGLTVERSNRLGFIEVQPFLRDQLLPHIRDGIIAEAVHLFP